MHRVIKCLAAAGALAGFASAQTINAPEGDWVWNGELNVNGLTLTNSGSTCLTSETAEIDLSAIFSNLNETCRISDWAEKEDAIHFGLNCSGEANMVGEIALGEEDASFTLAGAVRLGDAGPVTAEINGKAVRNGVCAVPPGPVEDGVDAKVTEVAAAAEIVEEAIEAEVIEVAAAPEAVEGATEKEVIEGSAIAPEAASEIADDAPKAVPVAAAEVTALSDDVAEVTAAPAAEGADA